MDVTRSKHYDRMLKLSCMELLTFCSCSGGHFGRLIATPKVTNRVLLCFLRKQRQTGGNLTLARHAVLVCQTMNRQLRGHLRPCWDLIQDWQESVPSQLRNPMPLLILESITVLARLYGMQASGLARFEWLALACLLEVGFWGLLRPGELYALTRGKITLPSDGT